MNPARKKFKIVVFNAQSVRNKKFELFDFIRKEKADVAFITETHLSAEDSCSDPDFSVIRLDRDDGRKGGGVALILRRGVEFRVLPCPLTEIIEACGAEVETPRGWISLVVAYFPGSRNAAMLRTFAQDIQLLFDLYPRAVIAGDFNARHNYWGCSRGNSAGDALFHKVMGSQVELYFPPEPTHFPHDGGTPSTIDLVMSKRVPVFSTPWTDPSLSSDHVPVMCELDLEAPEINAAPRLVKDYANTNWTAFATVVRRELADFTPSLASQPEIDTAIGALTQTIIAADDICVPKKELRCHGTRLTPDIVDLIRLRRNRRRAWQRSRDPTVKDQMRTLTAQIECKTRELVNKNFGKAVSKISQDPGAHRRKFWRLTKFLKNRPRSIPALNVDGRRLVSNVEKAEAFADHFNDIQTTASSSTRHDATSRLVDASVTEAENFNLDDEPWTSITLPEIEFEVSTLKNRKAPGSDQILNEHIKHLPPEALRLLERIFNACLSLGYFPIPWKLAIVKCILKPGKLPSSVCSYRPISLLSCMGKLFERLILNRLRQKIEDEQIFVPEQYGFVPGKSCTHQLYRTTRFIRRQLTLRKSVGMLCLDLKSAFDAIWHNGLVHKMMQFRFPMHVVKLVKSFLSSRRFQVMVGDSSSRNVRVTAGVPQGSVMAPTLFNLYTSDVPDLNGCQLFQFADDQAVAFASHSTSSITNRLQQVSNKLTRYLRRWRISVNGQKSELVLFGRKLAERHQPRVPILVDGNAVEWKTSLKYLGLKLDKRLTYKTHVDYICEKLGRVTKALYPLVCRRSKLDLNHKILLFKTIFRPTCTYAGPVWKDCSKTHRVRLQRMQNQFLKLALNLPRRTPTTTVHDLAKVELLQEFLERQNAGFVVGCQNNINSDIVELLNM